jgi:hypothetical protein
MAGESNMRKRWLAVLALTAALVWIPPAASADHGRGEGRKEHHGDRRADRHHDRGRDHEGWERHGDYEMRTYDFRGSRPPGWSRGVKTGWGNCGLPPGQARKYGCRTYVYQGVRYYYYEDDLGRIIVRRPFIEIHAVIR